MKKEREKMSKHYTTIKNNSSPAGTNSSGELASVKGYTYSKSPNKDENGHYVYSNPEEISPESKDCFAKEMFYDRPSGAGKTKYYVKTSSNGFLFNPWGMLSEGTQAKYDRGKGKSFWEFKEVPKKCFDFYTKFLQSRNKAWLSSAEREIQ